jgi:dienelactone hydrolase
MLKLTIVSVALLIPIWLYAQDLPSAKPGALPAEWFTTPLLKDHVRQHQMYAFVNANIPELPRFASLKEWQDYKHQVKLRILRQLGIDDILTKYKLKVIRKGVLERDGYRIEKIDYESSPGMYVPALVWIPSRRSGKAPAAVSISGHLYCDSKAADYVQIRDYNLMRRGFIVISYDYLGCNERGTIDACQPGAWGGEDHTNSLFSYTGRSTTGIEVLDGIRAVDYLYSRADVDRSRIAFTGESGGGNSTYWVSALDDRVTASIPVSSSGSFADWIKSDENYDWHQRPTGMRSFADIPTLYAMIAPRPLLVMNGHPELDEFPLSEALRSFEYAKSIYRLYGKDEAIKFHESTTDHGYQADKRVQLYDWLRRWFFNGLIPFGTQDLPYKPDSKEILKVGLPEQNLSLPALMRVWVKQLLDRPPVPSSLEKGLTWQREKRESLQRLLALKDFRSAPGVIYQYDYQARSGPYELDRLRFEVEQGVKLPALFVRKTGKAKYKTIIFLEKKRGVSDEAQQLVDEGYALLLLDVRGTGEVDWGGGRTSNWSDFVGRPAIGMWAEDISRVTTYLLTRPDVQSVAVLGYGLFGKAALYAAAVDDRILAAAITTDSISYRQEATSGLVHIYADVPRILTWGDTEQLAAMVAPRALAIFSAGLPRSNNNEEIGYFAPTPRFDGPDRGERDEDLIENYDWTRRFYGMMGAEPMLRLGSRGQTLAQNVAKWFPAHF